jgi:porin
VTAAETAIELSYLSQLASRVAMEPDLEYVVHPNADPRRSNAVVAQLRFEFKFLLRTDTCYVSRTNTSAL